MTETSGTMVRESRVGFGLADGFGLQKCETSKSEKSVQALISKHVLACGPGSLVDLLENPIRWNPANLPSGVYSYRMQSGTSVETNKFVLLRQHSAVTEGTCRTLITGRQEC